jgi:hypothetical protein
MRFSTFIESGLTCLTLTIMSSAAEIAVDGTVTTTNATELDVLVAFSELFHSGRLQGRHLRTR